MSFYTSSLHISKKTSSAILSKLHTATDRAPRPLSYELLMICLPLWMKTTFLFYSYWTVQPLLILLITKFFFHVSKLSFGIRSTALQWFRSYLLDRNQSVVVNNSASSPSPLMSEVQQGSVLGPVLFVLYTTPLSDIIASHSVNHQPFADDTQLQNQLHQTTYKVLHVTCHNEQMT